MMRFSRRAFLGAGALALAACTVPESGPSSLAFAADPGAQQAKIAALQQAILALGPSVWHDEAARVARIAVLEPLAWAREWGAVDAPLTHNIQVNTGRKPRGLCKHWADDLERRLKQQGLQSLDLHRAIANADNIRIEHSTVIITARGAAMQDGLVLDPWRLGQGRLWFGLVRSDPKYRWVPRAEVFAMKRARKARQALKAAR